MSILKILTYPNPLLRRHSEPVQTFDAAVLKQDIKDLFETMYAADGLGLAAMQVGDTRAIFVVDIMDEESSPVEIKRAFINPEIHVLSTPEQMNSEGCLSVPGIRGEVSRPEHILIKAQDETGKAFELEVRGFAAVCLQHELEHLHGRLFIDHLTPMKRRQFIKAYNKLHNLK